MRRLRMPFRHVSVVPPTGIEPVLPKEPVPKAGASAEFRQSGVVAEAGFAPALTGV